MLEVVNIKKFMRGKKRMERFLGVLSMGRELCNYKGSSSSSSSSSGSGLLVMCLNSTHAVFCGVSEEIGLIVMNVLGRGIDFWAFAKEYSFAPSPINARTCYILWTCGCACSMCRFHRHAAEAKVSQHASTHAREPSFGQSLESFTRHQDLFIDTAI